MIPTLLQDMVLVYFRFAAFSLNESHIPEKVMEGEFHIKLVKVCDHLSTANEIGLLTGKSSCPPEDSCRLEGAGSKGYAEFLAEYKANPSSSKVKAVTSEIQHRAQNYSRSWSGSRFDIIT